MGVKFIRNLETLFETYIEGFFLKKLSGGLQPVEIAKHLLQKMDDERSISVDNIYVPNSYTIYLNPMDYERLKPYKDAICEELSGYITDGVRQKGYTIIGEPLITFDQDKQVAAGNFQITTQFIEPLAQRGVNHSQQALSDTRIFNKISPIIENKRALSAVLRVIEGIDTGKTVKLGKGRINLGRREGNELALTDMNMSRLHAYISFEEDCHVLHDAKSLNGTYVNGQRVSRKVLQGGERIKMGNTVILYEVK
ncbi:hypothetical protein P22_0283 [Propionispora sp. 2/2-37]|uniref:FhaA domain-containing protein n=1 Tax=Propionispora sp. 2/2-37 TaxID=1677858 RepID=UPI0006BB8B45|nr:DUF3662 and FHA domain-containing protein [Propionispora sp. 2/2-37]CUH94217.1 hypothetical protein P22_0283 [Propionispora sp. 2/2-37]